jgi:hypothetical protein
MLVTANVPSSIHLYERRFVQEPRGVTYKKTAFFKPFLVSGTVQLERWEDANRRGIKI